MDKNTKTKNIDAKKVKKIIGRITTVILACVFILAIFCLGYICIQTMTGKETNLFGYRLFYVLSDSMSPTIEANEMILSKQIENTDDFEYIDNLINVDDIVTFTQTTGSTTITNTHRVYKDVYFDASLNCYCIVTKGDNPSATVDAPIPIANLQAKMVIKVTTLAEIYSFIGSTGGIACLIIIPMALMLISLIYQLIMKIKHPAGEEEKVEYLNKEQKEEIRLKREKEIAEQAVQAYILEQKKKEIADKAISDYINNQKENK